MAHFKLILVAFLACACGSAPGAIAIALAAHERQRAYDDGFEHGYGEGIREAEAASWETAECYDTGHTASR